MFIYLFNIILLCKIYILNKKIGAYNIINVCIIVPFKFGWIQVFI